MRAGWEYKKLGEVCEIARGGSPRPITDFITDDADGINWIKIGDAVEGDKYIRSTKEKIRPEGMKKSRLVHKGDFILSNSMSFGRPYILDIEGCIHDGWLVLHDNNNVFNKDFLYFLLSSPIMYAQFKRMAVGGVVNNLNSKLVSNVTVAIPPIPQQRLIVSELDEINSLIALKREQLKKYDELAQSLFYEMFGDPVENEKGWVVKKWNDVLTIINGRNQKEVEDPNGCYPICGSGGVMGRANQFLCPLNCTIIGRKGNINKPIFMKEPFWNVDTAFGLSAKEEILEPVFLFYFCTQYNFDHLNKAVTIPSLTKADLLKVSIPLPPLSLQRLFAHRIEQIEEQKKQITAAIAKLEILLASRMQYWFE